MRYKEGSTIYDNIEEATEDLVKRCGYEVKVMKSPDSLKEHIKQLTWTRAEEREDSASTSSREVHYRKAPNI